MTSMYEEGYTGDPIEDLTVELDTANSILGALLSGYNLCHDSVVTDEEPHHYEDGTEFHTWWTHPEPIRLTATQHAHLTTLTTQNQK